ncbi:peptidoglycan recognition protein family protein [Cytobacillus oceanisediminis]|uniref:peptidoglycan recognition protein family protein n=1 Tax=Cytobacillus oceanisediminis TaxID=665099 RepID=UPI00205C9A14|nr:LysM peptidoglycan-binding domain-containing protein [Cytobacillus oceanisediminis]UOE58164.1 LysM peptidoglycan-binding domain-containing protein [Cytobacillus oceanisediminis]
MTIAVRKMLVATSKYGIKAPYPMTAEYITVHNTLNDATAENEVKYMIGNNNEVSFHYAIDDREVILGVPENRNAWHCGDSSKGDGNRKSIGVEICYSKSGGPRYEKAEALAIRFIAQMLHERKWGIDRVRTHKSWTEIGVRRGLSRYVKNCPHRILDANRWDDFLGAVKKELDALNKPAETVVKPVYKPAATSGTHTVVAGDTLWSLSVQYKTTVANLKEWNGLTSDSLSVGQVLSVTGAVYTVVSGDTLYSLAKKFDMTVDELKKANGLPSNELSIGQKLSVKGKVAHEPMQAAPKPAPAPKPSPAPKPVAKKKLFLPATADTWRVYPTNKAPVAGNEKGMLAPKKFGGLTYEILKSRGNHIYEIQTSSFGRVQIFAGPGTGAIIK